MWLIVQSWSLPTSPSPRSEQHITLVWLFFALLPLTFAVFYPFSLCWVPGIGSSGCQLLWRQCCGEDMFIQAYTLSCWWTEANECCATSVGGPPPIGQDLYICSQMSSGIPFCCRLKPDFAKTETVWVRVSCVVGCSARHVLIVWWVE